MFTGLIMMQHGTHTFIAHHALVHTHILSPMLFFLCIGLPGCIGNFTLESFSRHPVQNQNCSLNIWLYSMTGEKTKVNHLHCTVRLALRIHALEMAAWKTHWQYSGTSSNLIHAVITFVLEDEIQMSQRSFFKKAMWIGQNHPMWQALRFPIWRRQL